MTVTVEQATGRFVTANGVRIHYGDIGTGDPVVLLHGAGPGADGWGNFRSNIDALAAVHRVIVPDLPRFGRSDKPRTDQPRLDFLSGVMAAFVEALGLARVHLVGNSLGGQTALKLAIDRPELVGRVVVIGSNAISRSIFSPLPSEAVRLISGYYQDQGPTIEKMREVIRALVYDQSLVTDQVVAERYEASIDPEVIALNREGHWPRQSLDEDLRRLQSQVLIVWGQDDRASPLDGALTMLRLIPDARLHVFARCGHWVQVEHAAEFNRLILSFLAA